MATAKFKPCRKIPRILTHEHLKKWKACASGRQVFRNSLPNGVEFTKSGIRAALRTEAGEWRGFVIDHMLGAMAYKTAAYMSMTARDAETWNRYYNGDITEASRRSAIKSSFVRLLDELGVLYPERKKPTKKSKPARVRRKK